MDGANAAIRHWTDIECAAVMEREGEKPWVDFKCYELVSYNPDYLYHVQDYVDSMDVTESLDEAQVYLSGRIKWDGCADLKFADETLHFCGRSNAVNVGVLLGRLYDLAAELMPQNADDLR